MQPTERAELQAIMDRCEQLGNMAHKIHWLEPVDPKGRAFRDHTAEALAALRRADQLLEQAEKARPKRGQKSG